MSDKIHPPTPRRRQKAREQGRAPRSSDVISAGLLLGTTAVLSFLGPGLAEGLMASMSETFSEPAELSIDRVGAFKMIVRSLAAIGYLVLPLLLAMMALGISLNLLQTGWMPTPSKLLPAVERISPANRIKTILSVRSLGRFAITLLKLVTVVAVSIFLIQEKMPDLIGVTTLPMPAIAAKIFDTLLSGCFWIGMTLLTFACVDYSLARWQFERELMMTEQELRDELRDMERTPLPASARSREVQGVS